MADPFKATGNYFAAREQSKAAKGAARAQSDMAKLAVSEQQMAENEIINLLTPYMQVGRPDLTQPYIQAGEQALQGLQGLLGLRGAGEQQAAIQGIEQGAQFQELARQGEQGILQNASATGGLRGGNTQAALAQFRPSLLNQLIESQYGKLAGLTSMGGTAAQNLLGMGQQTAASLANAQQQTGANIGNFLTQMGAAQAGGILGAGKAYAGLYQNLGAGPSELVKEAAQLAALGRIGKQ
jgi:hypothetical protein